MPKKRIKTIGDGKSKEKTTKKSEGRIRDFHDAWWFLLAHPIFERTWHGSKTTSHEFLEALDIYVTKVDPKTNRVEWDNEKNEANEARNTKTQVWLECGGWMPRKEFQLSKGAAKDFVGAYCHDVKLDCGADTFEVAIIVLANLVLKHYGSYASGKTFIRRKKTFIRRKKV